MVTGVISRLANSLPRQKRRSEMQQVWDAPLPSRLLRDITTQIMPYSRTTPFFELLCGQDVARQIAKGLSGRIDIDDAIRDWIRGHSSWFCVHGSLEYDLRIKFLNDGKQLDRVAFISKHVAQMGSHFDSDLDIAQSVALPPGSNAKLKNVFRHLSKIDDMSIPGFGLSSPFDGNPLDFDIHEFENNQSLAVSRICKHIGWGTDRLFPPYHRQMVTEYYWLLRTAKFDLLLLEIREALIDSIGRSLEAIGKEIGTPITLEVRSDTTAFGSRQLLEKYERGELSMERFYQIWPKSLEDRQ